MDGVEYLFTDFRLDPDGPCLYQVDKTGQAAEKLVQLSDHAHALLDLLIERKGDVVPPRDIFKRVWNVGPRDMDLFNIHGLVSELRKAIGHACVETAARRGYRFAVEVVE